MRVSYVSENTRHEFQTWSGAFTSLHSCYLSKSRGKVMAFPHDLSFYIFPGETPYSCLNDLLNRGYVIYTNFIRHLGYISEILQQQCAALLRRIVLINSVGD